MQPLCHFQLHIGNDRMSMLLWGQSDRGVSVIDDVNRVFFFSFIHYSLRKPLQHNKHCIYCK